MSQATINYLTKIIETKREEIESLIMPKTIEDLIRNSRKSRFKEAISRSNEKSLNLIAEVKKVSPSEGTIRENVDIREITRLYKECNVDAISILTDKRFDGQTTDLIKARTRGKNEPKCYLPERPMLRKDFIIHEKQIYESKLYKADAILLIATILEQKQLEEYLQLTKDMYMDALVEVHDESDLEKALRAGADTIGINNRDLQTFKIDLGTTKRLAPIIAKENKNITIVTESGIENYEQVQKLKSYGAHAMLVGTRIISEKLNPTSKDMKETIYRLQGNKDIELIS